MISLLRLFESKDQILYCDMDGVLTDFNRTIKKLGFKGVVPPTNPEEKKMTWSFVKNLGPKFWSSMEWLPEGKRLWELIQPYNPIILSSSGKGKIAEQGKEGKMEWIKRELGNKYADSAIIVNTHGKTKYASSNSILIDDDEMKNIVPWRNAGGIGILHKNNSATLGQLKKVMKG